MGTVYRAFDERLGRRVALKIVRRDASSERSGENTARLLREARAAAALHDANVVAVFDVGEHDGETFVAMELVSGKPLRSFVGDDSISLATRLRWLAEIGRGLAAAHRAGLVHRDVKPENVMISDDGVVKVLDFGIARRPRGAVDPTAPTDAGGMGTITQAGVIIGTPLYMAPEQLRGDADARSDQFAWGVVAYELLSGELPWKRTDAVALVASILADVPPPLRVEELPPEIANAVAKALAKTPDERFASMEEVVTVFSGLTTLSGQRASKAHPVRRTRRGVWMAAAGGIVATGVAATLMLTRGPAGVRAEPMPRTTNPVALAAYKDALIAFREGQDETYVALLERAIGADPALAAAQLRLAIQNIWWRGGSPAAARAYGEAARRGRESLSPRERELLDAVEPALTHEPPAFDETSQRLHTAAARGGDDALLRIIDCDFTIVANRPRDALAACRSALAADPQLVRSRVRLSEALQRVGSETGALEELAQCADAMPPSSACLLTRVFMHRGAGRCEAMAKDAHRVSRLESSGSRGWLSEGEARASLGAPVAEVAELFGQAQAHMRPATRAIAEPNYDIYLAALAGRLGDAIAAVPRYEAAIAGDDEAGRHLAAAHTLAQLQIETGDIAAAGRTAAAARARWAAWGAPRWLEEDLRPALVAIEVRAGLLARPEAKVLVARWDGEWRARFPGDASPGVVSERWAMMNAAGVETKEEATEALRLGVSGGDSTYLGISLLASAAPYGRALLRAGRADEAIPLLRRAAAYCQEARGIFGVFAARLDLGEALAAKGDAKGACDAWREIVFRWGHATPRSVTVERVKERGKELGCGF